MAKTVMNSAICSVSSAETITFKPHYDIFHVRNDGSTTIYASGTNSTLTAGDDGVVSIPKGGSVSIPDLNDDGIIYVSGACTVINSTQSVNPFKVAEGYPDLSAYYTKTESDTLLGAKMNSVNPVGSGSFNFTVDGNTGSFVAGYNCAATGRRAMALGNNAHAYGKDSFAIDGAAAYGESSIAMGAQCSTTGICAIAMGRGAVASATNQTAFGNFNLADTTSLLIIGNGTAATNRSNALTMDTSGNTVISGTIQATNIPAPPSTDGTYVLKCTVTDGVASYAWTAET